MRANRLVHVTLFSSLAVLAMAAAPRQAIAGSDPDIDVTGAIIRAGEKAGDKEASRARGDYNRAVRDLTGQAVKRIDQGDPLTKELGKEIRDFGKYFKMDRNGSIAGVKVFCGGGGRSNKTGSVPGSWLTQDGATSDLAKSEAVLKARAVATTNLEAAIDRQLAQDYQAAMRSQPAGTAQPVVVSPPPVRTPVREVQTQTQPKTQGAGSRLPPPPRP